MMKGPKAVKLLSLLDFNMSNCVCTHTQMCFDCYVLERHDAAYNQATKAAEKWAHQVEIQRLIHEALNAPNGVPYPTSDCNHDYKKYVGLHETYEYCVHCDEKRK